jgi:hypothetical protein
VENICRVYLRDSAVLRSFYWFEHALDGSIYFGSSNTQTFKTGYAGTSRVVIDGTRIEPLVEGRSMAPAELKDKTSIHGSGIVKLPVRTDAARQRYEIAPPRIGFSVLPLVGILLMKPARYPSSAKTPKHTDLVLEPKRYSPHPLGLLFYLSKTEHLEPPPVLAAKSLYETLTTESISFGECRLCVSIYAQPLCFECWQPLEVSVLAHPQSAGEEPNWPFFG